MKAIRAEQAALLTQVHQPAIDLAGRALGVAQSAVTSDQLTLQADRAQAAAAAFAAAATRDRRATDLATLALAAARNHVAQGRLALDRDRLRGFALGVYTGALTGPQSPAVESLSSEQQADVGRREAAIIAQVVIADLNSDVDAAATAGRQYRQAQDTIGADQHELAVETNTAATAAARIPPDLSALAADQHQLATAQRRRQRVHADLTVALTAVVGPPALRSSGLSVLGMSALDGAQLAGWYNAQGYTDLTAASITQLASWYIQSGVAEGVRGDVAFAQAVLETGGFSSPDAVALNNYAGIGHCDSCAAGWPFPSPQTGVIGHLQLLRIFATAAPAPRRAPAPVLAALAPAHQSRRGCCPDWESLTGVWATDPLYAVSILSLYQSMLAFAATAGVPTVPSASQTSPAGSQPPSSGSQPPPSGSQPPPSSGGQASPAGSQPPPSGTQPPPASTTTTSPTTIPAPPSTT